MILNTPDRISAMPPQALGDDMDVPFISWVPRRVQLGTDAMAPPGALMLTPRAPSVLGPLDDQVYWLGGSFSLREYSATIMSGVTYAPTPEERRYRICMMIYDLMQLLLLLTIPIKKKLSVCTYDTACGSSRAAYCGEAWAIVSCT